MNTLAVLLSQVVTVLQESGYCGAVCVLETHPFSGRQFALKVRAELVSGGALQIRIYTKSISLKSPRILTTSVARPSVSAPSFGRARIDLPLDLAARPCYIGLGAFTISCERASRDAVTAALCSAMCAPFD